MIKVLLVEDDKNLCFILRSSLEQMIGGYQVTVATNGRQGLEALEREAFDVVVSDVEMPVMDGKEMTHAIRERHPNLAIILITGLTTARDVINGYQSGADFYIKKPFLPEELDAHIQAILRMKRENRPAPIAEKETNVTYTIGQYRFVPSGNQLLFGDERQNLTPKEARILEMLCRSKGEVVNRDEILTAIWDTADFYSSRSLDVFITKLRKYLSKDPNITLKVLKGVGICLEDRKNA